MIEKFIAGFFVTIIGALIIYAFRVRQLYVVVPRLFSTQTLSSKGRIAEVRIFNRSRLVEEDVLVNLDPALTYELVASTDTSCSLSAGGLKVPRIPPQDDYSAFLLVEPGDFASSRVGGISSKTSKGKLCQTVDAIPPNAGLVVLMCATMLAVAVVPIGAMEWYFDRQREQTQNEAKQRLEALSHFRQEGWRKLEDYSNSKLRAAYSDTEFPIYISSFERKGDVAYLKIRLINKTASEMLVSAHPTSPFAKKDPEPWKRNDLLVHKVPPQSANDAEIQIYVPRKESAEIPVEFTIYVGKREMISLLLECTVEA